MQEHEAERSLACELNAHHNHARYPEEQDVVACLKDLHSSCVSYTN
jgi:hypothetical protein